MSTGQRIRMVEHVAWHPHAVTFRLADGRRRRWIRWSPGGPWIRGEAARELEDRFNSPDELKAGSGRIRMIP